MKKVEVVTQSKIINILAPNKANLFCLNIFGISQIFIFLILNNLRRKIIYFQKNFKFKIHIQIKNILNFNPSPNNIPKAIGGENIKKRIDNTLNKANDPLRNKFFLFFLLRFFKVFHSHSMNM